MPHVTHAVLPVLDPYIERARLALSDAMQAYKDDDLLRLALDAAFDAIVVCNGIIDERRRHRDAPLALDVLSALDRGDATAIEARHLRDIATRLDSASSRDPAIHDARKVIVLIADVLSGGT